MSLVSACADEVQISILHILFYGIWQFRDFFHLEVVVLLLRSVFYVFTKYSEFMVQHACDGKHQL